MMKKGNKILVGCLALLLVLSVGYALFSDTITINGTATASGEFSLTTTCDMNVVEVVSEANGAGEIGLVTDAKISCEDNVVNASATLGYPGSEKWFRVMVTNTGTIPAKLSSVVELNNPDWAYCKKDDCPGQIENSVSNSERTNSAWVALFPSQTFLDDYAGSESEWGYEEMWQVDQFDAILDPGETAYFYVKMLWVLNSTKPGDPLTPTLNAELTWEQVTQ